VASFLQARSADHCLCAVWSDLGNGYLKRAEDEERRFMPYAVERQVGQMDSVSYEISPLQLKAALRPLYKPLPPNTQRMSFFCSALLSTPENSCKMAAVNMDSIQFYQPPFMNPWFGGKRTASPYIDPKPKVAAHCKKGSEVLKSVGITARGRWGNFGLEHNSGQDDNVADEDYLPTIEELLRPTSRKENSTQEPPNAESVGDSQGTQGMRSGSLSL
jgi:hypothetical protein